MNRRSLLQLLGAAPFALAAEPRRTRNVVLMTADGLRWQELFGGLDKSIPNKNTPLVTGVTREALFPYFWRELAPKGVVMRGRVTNSHRVSYPGYAEILTGRADDRIRGNDPIQNPNLTVLEFVRERLGLEKKDVALFGSWVRFREIAEHRKGSVVVNAGYQPYTEPEATARLRDLSALQFEILTAWPEVRHDYITFQLALEYVRSQRPRLLYIALGETDDWAHEKRYDRYLETAAYFDECLRTLWASVDQTDTTLVITVDHGRGATPSDWHSHGKDVAGADQIWAAVMGPDTPARGEIEDALEQRDIAPTILELLGLDYREYKGATGKPLRAAFS